MISLYQLKPMYANASFMNKAVNVVCIDQSRNRIELIWYITLKKSKMPIECSSTFN